MPGMHYSTKNIACKGGTNHLSRITVSILSKYPLLCLCNFNSALFELFKKMVNSKKQISLPKFLSRKKNNNKMMASILGSMPNKSFELVKAWMWTTNPKTKVLYPSRKYLLSTNLLQEWKKTTLGAAYITPTSTQRCFVQWEGKCTRNQAEQMQSFATSK